MRLMLVMATMFAVLLTGCDSNDRDIYSAEFDINFQERLRDLSLEGKTVPLQGLVPGEWDTVQVFPGYYTKEEIEREVGSSLPEMADSYHDEGNILLFSRNGVFVRLVRVTAPLFKQGKFSSEVRVHVTKKGKYTLEDPAVSN